MNKRNFYILNTFLAFAVAVLFIQGFVWPLFRDDASHLSAAIVGWWAVGLAACGRGDWDRASEIADDLVFLGLLGTVIGFAQALTAITPENLVAGAADKMVGMFVQGARTALYTTIVGAVGNYWLRLNHLFLRARGS